MLSSITNMFGCKRGASTEEIFGACSANETKLQAVDALQDKGWPKKLVVLSSASNTIAFAFRVRHMEGR